MVLVRLGAPDAPATTMYVVWGTGGVGCVDGSTFVESVGRISQRVTFSDDREVGGAVLPWHAKIELAIPLIGAIEVAIEEVELGSETCAACSSCATESAREGGLFDSAGAPPYPQPFLWLAR